jgi:hypothetical protein
LHQQCDAGATGQCANNDQRFHIIYRVEGGKFGSDENSMSQISPGLRVPLQGGDMKRLLDRIGELWCINVHRSAMWPVRGQYRCAVCLREYPVKFESSQEVAATRPNNVFPITRRLPDAGRVRETATPAPNSIPA